MCGGDHRFDNCTVLKDTQFSRDHHIRHCQHLRRDATARAQAFIGAAGELPVKPAKKRAAPKKPKKAGTNLVDVHEEPSAQDHDEQDFHQGQA